MKKIPVVNLRKYVAGDAAQRAEFIRETGDAFRQIGFVVVKNHGIPKAVVDRFYALSQEFYALPEEVKRKYEVPGLAGQRGYTSFGREHAKGFDKPDLKEFFQIGQEIEDEDVIKSEYPDNVFVEEVPDFVPTGIALYRMFELTGAKLLRAIAEYLGLQRDYFDAKIHHGNSILRSIYYPPITEEPASAIRAEQHEDINLITLLVGASAGGLQVQNQDGEWIEAMPAEDEIVINAGDMLQRLTNNYLPSTTHRVVNPPRERWHEPRLSIPFFLHPRSEMDLSCLPSCVTEENPLRYPPITAGEYLDERLREIGLKK